MGIIDTLTLWIQTLWQSFQDMGYYGIALGLMIEVIPSEIVLAYGGYLFHKGDIGFFEAVIAGTIGGVLAQIFLYVLGYWGGRPFLEKYGRYLFILPKHLKASNQWFAQYGIPAIFFARFIPVVRHAISIPAGIARMSFWRFTLLTTLAIIPWSIFFVYLGYKLGNHWTSIKDAIQPYLPYTTAAILLIFIAWWWIRRRKTRKNKV